MIEICKHKLNDEFSYTIAIKLHSAFSLSMALKVDISYLYLIGSIRPAYCYSG